jgi:hypothetical protein
VTPLLSYSGPPMHGGSPTRMDAVRYTACSGAEVFASGSLQFSWGLDPWRDPSYTGSSQPPAPPANSGLQQAMAHALADLTQSHVPQPGPPDVCPPTVGFSVSTPWAAVGEPVTFSSSATDPYGVLASQTWSFSGPRASGTATGTKVTRAVGSAGQVSVALAAADSSGTTTTEVKTLAVCACPPPGRAAAVAWTPGATDGTPCQLVPIGSLRRVQKRYWFEPHGSISSYTLTTYRLKPTAARTATVRIASATVRITSAKASAGLRLPVGSAKAPELAEVTSRTGGRLLRQQFLLAAPGLSPQPLTELLCDGTSARVLTAAFGAKLSTPLRVAVGGPGRLVVTVLSQSGATVYKRTVRAGVLVFSSKGMGKGLYRIVVRSRRSRLAQSVVVTAARV